MRAEKAADQAVGSRAGALPVLNAAEKALLEATGRCSADGRGNLGLAERFLGIARRRFLFQDWDGARLFGRMAIEYAGKVVPEKGTTPSALDQRDPL